MQELSSSIVNPLGLSGVVLFVILFTWILYRGECNSRKNGSFTASYGITCFVAIMAGFLITPFSGAFSSPSAVEQVMYWILILFLSLYLVFLMQDMRRELKEYRTRRDKESSLEIDAY